MAKKRDEVAGLVELPAEQSSEAQAQPDPRDQELAALRAMLAVSQSEGAQLKELLASADDEMHRQSAKHHSAVAQLQQRLRELASPELAKRAPGIYRVSLEGAVCRRAKVTVEPHERRRQDRLGTDGRLLVVSRPDPMEFDALELFIAHPEGNIQQEAWRRYAKRHALDPWRDRREFRVRIEGGPTLQSLDIPAESPYEAEALFKRFSGILATDRQFTTILLPAEGQVDGGSEAAA